MIFKRASWLAAGAAATLAVTLAAPAATQAAARPAGPAIRIRVGHQAPLSAAQKRYLVAIGRSTWRFFEADVNPRTHLPEDNLGPGKARGIYTSAANIGVYLWAVTAARDLRIITDQQARARITATLDSVARLKRTDGFLHQWYNTNNGQTILNPGQGSCASDTTPQQDNCWFLSAVDNGWYASGLIVVRNAFPQLRPLASSLLAPMKFGIFYDSRPQSHCNVNAKIDDQPTGQMYGGYYVDQGPAAYHNSALYSDPRIAMYIGMGRHQMPGDVWWKSWRVLPPKQCATDPDFSWQGQPAPQGHWTEQRDPLSGRTFRVWEGHYTYPGTGGFRFLPTFAGGMFEALMPNEVVPETTWGRRSFGEADVRTAEVQRYYALHQLHYPVWGMSPSSTADNTGDYGGFGVEGLTLPKGHQLSQCVTCATETTVTPHASFLALAVIPQAAYANIVRLRALYPGLYTTSGGFYDAVNPVTGSIGHRRLVLDQSMIMAAIDNAVNGRQLQRWFAMDPTARAAHEVLAAERMSL